MPFKHERKGFSKGPYRPHQPKSNLSSKNVEKLGETDVGITEYISTLPGISGVIKSRFSDFHVNEINCNGDVAKLTHIEVPSAFTESTDEEVDSSSELISEETWVSLRNVVATEDAAPVDIDVTNLSKEDRTKVHKAVKKAFGNKIVASTKLVEEKKFIEVKRFTKGERQDRRTQWPVGLGEYVYFMVHKEGIDTIQATFKIGDRLKIESSAFTYAGVKDRRAKTTQWYCVKKVDPNKLISLCKCFHKIHVGNVEFKNEPLKLGQLQGNKFRIAIRNVVAENSLIESSMSSLQNQGFINYYGLQRFGNDKEVPTYKIGVKLLQGNWKEACNLILKVKSSDEPLDDLTQAKKVYSNTSNAQLALKEFSKTSRKCLEMKLLNGLANNHSNDYVTALENMPRNIRLLYLHAFQSLIWNRVVSRRIKELGLQPVVGDLVFANQAQVVDEQDRDDSEEDVKPEVKVLSEADLPNYTIYDLIMPLPGYDVIYPENEAKTWYSEALEKYSLTLEMPKQKVKTYNLSGTYRNMISRVSDMTWKILNYDHPNDVLIRSDYEELKGETELEINPDGKYKAIVVEFSLNSSNYATMTLREILKMDTSSLAQSQLNGYHETKVKVEENKEFAKVDSLLDSDKYKDFKNAIYGDDESGENDDGMKRKHEEDGEEELSTGKKIKNDVEQS